MVTDGPRPSNFHNKTMAIPVLSQVTEVLWNCALTWFYIYSAWLYSSELICCAFPIAIVGSILLFVAIYFLRVPPPDRKVVDDLLGLDPWYVDETSLNETDSYFMKCCAHRGAGLDAPENSISAFRRSKEKGCTAVEFDIVLTKDLVPIVFHDPDVNRLCDATGAIKDMTWDELKDLDISVKHPLRERYTGEKIARFEEAIEVCLDLGLRMFLDIKGDDNRIIPIILEAFKKHEQLYSRAVVSSFNPIFIYMVRRADPQIVGSLAWRPCFFTYSNYSGMKGAERPRYSNPMKHCAAQVLDTVHSWALDHLTYYILGLSTILLINVEVTAYYPLYLCTDKGAPQKPGGCLRHVIGTIGHIGTNPRVTICNTDIWLADTHSSLTSASIRLMWKKIALRWHKRGVRPIAWTVNLPVEKQYFKQILKVTYMTDTLES